MNAVKALWRGMVCAAALLGFVPSAEAQGVPGTMAFVARLQDGGTNVTGPRRVQFTILDAASMGNVVWQETHPALQVVDGILYAELGALTALDAAIFDGTNRWLEVMVESTVLTPRVSLASIPYAMRAGVATSADALGGFGPGDVVTSVTGTGAVTAQRTANSVTLTVDTSGLQPRIMGGCAPGFYMRGVQADGSVLCDPDANSGGDVTSVQAGPGLSGGGASGDVNLQVAFGAAANTVTQGNDPRLPPPPGVPGRLLYDNGSAWVVLPPGTAGQVLSGGALPAWTATPGITGVGVLSSLAVTGDITAGGLLFSAPRNGNVSVHASSFTPPQSSDGYGSLQAAGNSRYANGPTGYLAATLNIPAGARLTNVRFFFRHTATPGDILLGVADSVSNTWVCLATASTVAAGTQTVDVPCNQAFDAATQLWMVRFAPTVACGSNCFVYGANATYTVTSLP